MSLITETDIYAPSVDDCGNYVDKIPSFNNLVHGLRCPCGSRKDKTYDTHMSFTSHIKTKTHQKWLGDLTLNKTNYYVENESLKTTLQSQRQIIAKLEIELHVKTTTVESLVQQLTAKKIAVGNLLSFD